MSSALELFHYRYCFYIIELVGNISFRIITEILRLLDVQSQAKINITAPDYHNMSINLKAVYIIHYPPPVYFPSYINYVCVPEVE